MKRSNICIATALTAVLSIGALGGCGGQTSSSASSDSATSADSSEVSSSTTTSTASEQSQDEVLAELRTAIANAPAFKSVTVTEEEEAIMAGEDDISSSSSDSDAATDTDSIKATTVYKFDESGDQIKTNASADVEGVALQYYTDGDDAVLVTDGSAYSGTTEQFDLKQAKGLKQYLTEVIGDLDTLVGCAASAEKMESNGLSFYMLTLDPQKYIASDEILTLMAENGSEVKKALFTIGFDEDGHIASIDLGVSYSTLTSMKHMMFSDYDSTTVDAMPAADKTYEEMEADMKEKLEDFEKEIDSNAESTTTSEDAAASSTEAATE